MMEKKLLIREPLVTSSPTIASLFTIIYGKSGLENWIINNFNNLLFISNEHEARCIFLEDQPNYKATIFSEVDFFKSNSIKYDLLAMFEQDIISFIVSAINKDYYIRLAVDNYFLKVSIENYQLKHYIHPLLVYGYNLDREVLYVGEFFDMKKYGFYEIPFIEFQNAYSNCLYSDSLVDEYLENIVAVKLNLKYHEEINWFKFANDMDDYLNGIDRTNKYLYPQRKKGSFFLYGINSYDGFLSSIKGGHLDYRSAHVFYDRMKLLKYKVDLLYKGLYISKDEYTYFSSLGLELINKAQIARNIFLKIFIKKQCSKTDIVNVELKYNELKDAEAKFLASLKNIICSRWIYRCGETACPEDRKPSVRTSGNHYSCGGAAVPETG